MLDRLTVRGLYGLIGLTSLCLVAVWAVGHVRHDQWADTWLPNFIAEAVGIFFTVAVVEAVVRRNLESERETNLRPVLEAAARSVMRVLERTALRQLMLDWVRTYGSDPPPSLAVDFVDAWRTRVDVRSLVQVDLDDVEGSWITQFDKAIGRTAAALADVRLRYATFLPPETLTTLDDFVDGFERDQDIIEGMVAFPRSPTMEEHLRVLEDHKVARLDASVARLRTLIWAAEALQGEQLKTQSLHRKVDMEARLIQTLFGSSADDDQSDSPADQPT